MKTYLEKRIWNSYRAICQATRNPNNPQYQLYQRLGLDVGNAWDTFTEFYDYVVNKLGMPPGNEYKLIRKNQTRSWEPGNLKWGTAKEQGQRYAKNIFIRYQGQMRSISDWAESLGMNASTLSSRYRRGWPLKQVFSTTLIKPKNKKNISGTQ